MIPSHFGLFHFGLSEKGEDLSPQIGKDIFVHDKKSALKILFVLGKNHERTSQLEGENKELNFMLSKQKLILLIWKTKKDRSNLLYFMTFL